MRKARRKKRLSPFEAKIEFQRSQNFLQELGKQTEREVIAKDLKNRRVFLNE
jgi:outer membrane lipopolysaccharide assembly protein LptE/RlpB